jgi:hypothetical protein
MPRPRLTDRIDDLNYTEHDEQAALFQWAIMRECIYPELALMFCIPNGGWRHPATARKLQSEGVKRGVPDIYLPTARGTWHGLFIEMKRSDGGRESDEQARYRIELSNQGYLAVVCHGWLAASQVIEEYLTCIS